jgi:peroxiredoxin Q/BCP
MLMQKPPYQAPAFHLPDEKGTIHSLDDWKGKWIVLYFYPEDDTPGCTIQACSLRDARDELQEIGAVVVGVSKDSVNSHDAFKAKHSLNFTLLSDEKKEAIEAYGAWGKKMFGIEGVLRKTFLIDPAGIVRKVYGRAVPVGHGDKVLKDLKTLMQAS